MTRRLTMMVVILVFLGSTVFVLGANAEETVNYLQERNGVYYKVNQEKGFTGRYLEISLNGQKKEEFRTVNGKIEGLVVSWYENGQKSFGRHYKNGELEGLDTSWAINGQKSLERHFKNGKLEGLATKWHWNGKKTSEQRYKNGEVVEVLCCD